MVKLCCVFTGGSESAFHVDIDKNAFVSDLKKKIKAENPNTVKCDARLLELFLAKKEGGAWLTGKDAKDGVKDTAGLKPLGPQAKIYKAVLSETALRPEATGEEMADLRAPVDVVVVIPDRMTSYLYLYTSLHVWDDATLVNYLSADFKNELVQYRKLHPKSTVELSGTEAMTGQTILMKQRQSIHETAKLKRVLQFSLHPSVCLRCSAEFDNAVFKVPMTDDIAIDRGEMSISFSDPRRVDVYGYPDDTIGRTIPARVTSWSENRMGYSFSAIPGVVTTGLLITKESSTVGYIGRGVDGLSKTKSYQANAFTFNGLSWKPVPRS